MQLSNWESKVRRACIALRWICLATAIAQAEGLATKPQSAPSSGPSDAAAERSNLDYWLEQSTPATTSPATQAITSPAGTKGVSATRPDALPGVIEISDGRQLPGWMYTTRGRDLEVWVESEKRWRRVPLLSILSLTAVVIEQEMVQQWRWKEMGQPERVYTGKQFPAMRFLWKVHLIDDSYVVGAIRGQPLWVSLNGQSYGPFVLYDRAKGDLGQELAEIVYIRQAIISRRMLDKLLRAGPGR